jgi:hypothetical protein
MIFSANQKKVIKSPHKLSDLFNYIYKSKKISFAKRESTYYGRDLRFGV